MDKTRLIDKKKLQININKFKGTSFIVLSPTNFGGLLFFWTFFGAFTYRGLGDKSIIFFILGLLCFTIALYFIAKAKEEQG